MSALMSGSSVCALMVMNGRLEATEYPQSFVGCVTTTVKIDSIFSVLDMSYTLHNRTIEYNKI